MGFKTPFQIPTLCQKKPTLENKKRANPAIMSQYHSLKLNWCVWNKGGLKDLNFTVTCCYFFKWFGQQKSQNIIKMWPRKILNKNFQPVDWSDNHRGWLQQSILFSKLDYCHDSSLGIAVFRWRFAFERVFLELRGFNISLHQIFKFKRSNIVI